MANITQIKQQHILASGTAGGRRGGEDCSLLAHKSQFQTQVLLTQPYLHSPKQTQVHPSSPPFPGQQVTCLVFSLYLVHSTSSIFSSVLNLTLNAVSSPAFFLEVVTVLNLKFASHSQQKAIQLSRHNKKQTSKQTKNPTTNHAVVSLS